MSVSNSTSFARSSSARGLSAKSIPVPSSLSPDRTLLRLGADFSGAGRAAHPRSRARWSAGGRSPMSTVTDVGPLDGVRVLELGSFIAGPFAGQLLGDLGADVIKVEPPGGGDPMRQWGVCVDGRSLWWPAIARNKRSVALDLRDARARAAVRRIAATCDVVVENFRPGQLARFGLDYETL